nr:MAG TPA_asm: hypothetical protein [Caudoviricetes sp.]
MTIHRTCAFITKNISNLSICSYLTLIRESDKNLPYL